jgi:DinB family protein
MSEVTASTAPHTGPELADAIARGADEVAAFMGGFDPERCFAPQGEAWSPAEHLEHLVRSVRPLAKGLAQPREELRARWGEADRPSRRFGEVVVGYRAELGKGARAAGPFVPDVAALPRDVVGQRALLERWREAAAALVAVVKAWSEEELDRLRIPHPLLGPLTVREMLMFTVYHDRHHLDLVRGRAGG